MRRLVWLLAISAAALGALLALRSGDAQPRTPDAPSRTPDATGRIPDADRRVACVRRPQPAGGRLWIGMLSRSNARACRPYELTHDRAETGNPNLPDVWWPLGRRGRVLDVALDEPFEARRITLEMYGYVVGDRPACGGSLAVSIDGGPARAVPVAATCRGEEYREAFHTVVLELERPTQIRRLRVIDQVDDDAQWLTLSGIELVAAATPERPKGRVVDVWAAVVEPPAGIPHMGLWLVAPGRRPRALSGPWTQEPGFEVAVWEHTRSTRVFLAPRIAPGELHVFDTATDARPHRIARLPAAIEDAWFDDCLGALELTLADGSHRFAFDDGRVATDACAP